MVFLRCTRHFHSPFCSVLQPSSVRGPVTPTADVLSPSIPAVSPRVVCVCVCVCVCDGTGRRRTKSRRGRAVAAAPRPARRGRVAGDDAVSPGAAAAGAPSVIPPATSASASSARSAAPDASATTTSDRGRTAAVHHHRVRVHTSARRRTRASFDVCEIKRVC